MQLGLFDLFDGAIAELLGVDTQTYISVIESENVSDEEQEQIIMGVLEGNEEGIKKAKELFETKLNK
jgi:hypothetical protein